MENDKPKGLRNIIGRLFPKKSMPDRNSSPVGESRLEKLPPEIFDMILQDVVTDSIPETTKTITNLRLGSRALKNRVDGSYTGEIQSGITRLGALAKTLHGLGLPKDHLPEARSDDKVNNVRIGSRQFTVRQLPRGFRINAPPVPGTAAGGEATMDRISVANATLPFASDGTKKQVASEIRNILHPDNMVTSALEAMNNITAYNQVDRAVFIHVAVDATRYVPEDSPSMDLITSRITKVRDHLTSSHQSQISELPPIQDLLNYKFALDTVQNPERHTPEDLSVSVGKIIDKLETPGFLNDERKHQAARTVVLVLEDNPKLREEHDLRISQICKKNEILDYEFALRTAEKPVLDNSEKLSNAVGKILDKLETPGFLNDERKHQAARTVVLVLEGNPKLRKEHDLRISQICEQNEILDYEFALRTAEKPVFDNSEKLPIAVGKIIGKLGTSDFLNDERQYVAVRTIVSLLEDRVDMKDHYQRFSELLERNKHWKKAIDDENDAFFSSDAPVNRSLGQQIHATLKTVDNLQNDSEGIARISGKSTTADLKMLVQHSDHINQARQELLSHRERSGREL